ncbi:hypothetical protein [Amycolatopsis sp. NPDC050768]|uniref:hypothetical protein n=1 Tax=Amycolatopsis sp. NPDC050768 TaxID=3154839 RepID=UPI0033F61FFA
MTTAAADRWVIDDLAADRVRAGDGGPVDHQRRVPEEAHRRVQERGDGVVGQGRFKVDETFSAPALPGVDAQYGFCGAATDAPDARKCFLFLAHGDRAEALQSSEVNDEGLKPGKAKKSLLTTLPMFAGAFTKDR